MKSGIREDARTAKIVAAIKIGVNTSRLLAAAFETTVANLSPEIDRLARMGAIKKAGTVQYPHGRPCIRYCVGPKPPPPTPRGCKEPGCNRVYFARGYCRKHYAYHRYAVAAE